MNMIGHDKVHILKDIKRAIKQTQKIVAYNFTVYLKDSAQWINFKCSET